MVTVAKKVSKEEHVVKPYKSPLTEALSIIEQSEKPSTPHNDRQCSRKPVKSSKLDHVHLDCSQASVGSLKGVVENTSVSYLHLCVCSVAYVVFFPSCQ